MTDNTLRDRFGLLLKPTIFDDQDEAVATLVRDVAASVTRAVGRNEARRLFKDALKKSVGGKGRQPDQGVNDDLLAQYESSVDLGLKPSKAIKKVAEENAGATEDPASLEKRIRRALKKLKKEIARREKINSAACKTIIGQAMFGSDADD